MAHKAMVAAYGEARKNPKPKVHFDVHVSSFDRGPDKEFLKEQKERLKVLRKEMKSFDRDKAADRAYSALLREEKRLANECEIGDMEG